MLSQKRSTNEPQAYVLATSMPLPQGTLLREQDVTWQGVAETKPGEFVRPSESELQAKPELENQYRANVYGAVLRHDLAAGAPILKDAIVKPGERDFLQVVLMPGQRAIAIPVATGGASTSLLSPGDRVDVILTQNFKNDSDAKAPLTRRSVSETVVENLRVLAIDASDTKPVQAAANPATGNFGRIVTLEVTPEQAEQINVATELGKLSLTLRSAADYASASYTPSVSPFAPIVRTVAHEPVDGHVDGYVRPTWAGDVSPALLGAAQAKPVAVTPPPVVILRGSKPQQDHQPVTEIIEQK
jgi:pilus assembly protein CpaB